MTAWLIAIGRMLGLGSIAGIRPSLTLAVIGVVSYFDWGVETNATFSWLDHWLAIGIFVVLAILESTFDKISKVDRLQDRLIMPYRCVMGGVAGAATAPFGWQGVVAGAVIGAGAAWFAQYTKHLSRPKSVPSEAVVTLISAAEDLGAFLGSVLVLAVPYFGYASAGVSGFVFWRVRDRRRAKYRRMRAAAARPRFAGADIRAPAGAADGACDTGGEGRPVGGAAARGGAGASPPASGASRPGPLADAEVPEVTALDAGASQVERRGADAG